MNKLYIYDESSKEDRSQAAGRFYGSDDRVTTVGVSSINQFLDTLVTLKKSKNTFARILVQTHGGVGRILFGKERLHVTDWGHKFSGKGLEALAEPSARIQFDGCNVAEGALGWAFLEGAGKVFLRAGGGASSGWTSLGLGMPGWIPGVGGHTIHVTGSFRTVFFDNAGNVTERYEQ